MDEVGLTTLALDAWESTGGVDATCVKIGSGPGESRWSHDIFYLLAQIVRSECSRMRLRSGLRPDR